MNTAVITIKTHPELKKQAQEIAEELGFNLSSFINASLKKLVRTRSIDFSLDEVPSDYFIQSMKEAEEDVKAGRVSPVFDNADDAVVWLHTDDKE